MPPLQSEPPVGDQADLAGSRLALRMPEEQPLQRQPRDIESAVDLPLRDFIAMSPSSTRSDNIRHVSGRMEEGKQQQDNHHMRSSSGNVSRPKSSGRRITTGDSMVLSRSKGGSHVIRRVNSSYGPKPARVEDADDMESTRAVNSDSETEVMWPEPDSDRINSTTFVAKTATTTEVGKVLSGRPTDVVDPVFLSELSQHEKRRIRLAASPKTGSSQTSSTLVYSSSDGKSSPDTLQSYNGRYGVRPTDKWSPRSNSSSTSNSSNSQRSTAETLGTTPHLNVTGDTAHIGLGLGNSVPSTTYSRDNTTASKAASLDPHTPGWRYGTPEMARGRAKLPVLSPDELQPRPAVPGLGYAKHLPRAEKLPMSGYELLASKLSTSGPRPRPVSAGPGYATNFSKERDAAIKPIYRRFEALNHRLLLHLQDELSELEEQLHRLDTADTQTRRLQNSILPASRRAESVAPGELQWHKTDILSRIGSKLNQYNQALSSFSETQHLPHARTPDIEVYRSFLTTQNPIAETETHFLDTTEDLVSLFKSYPSFIPPYPNPTSSKSASVSFFYGETGSDDALPHSMQSRSTPVSATQRKSSTTPRRHRNAADKKGNNSGSQREKSAIFSLDNTKSRLNSFAVTANNYPVGQVAALAALAVLLPVVVFRITEVGFAGRMAVVLVVGLLVGALRQTLGDAGFWIGGGGDHGGGQILISAVDVGTVVGVYGVVMSLVAVLI